MTALNAPLPRRSLFSAALTTAGVSSGTDLVVRSVTVRRALMSGQIRR